MEKGNGSALVSAMYGYDALGNITSVNLAQSPYYPVIKYYYDDQNQLIQEDYYDGQGSDNSHITDSYTYTYDTAGNLLTESKNGTVTKTYSYDNSQWNDLLTKYNGTTITYDSAGNPTAYTNGTALYSMMWTEGRRLSYMMVDGATGLLQMSYSYDADGIRYKKVVDTTVHQYVTQNGKIVREIIGSGNTAKVLDFIYDESGKPFALKYTNGAAEPITYYYILNLQGDVLGLINASGTIVARYTYNAWGEILTATGTMAEINPLRYRGYYYDTETGFYYLQSRYYDPVTHRFINADSLASTGQGVIGTNMFSYCLNNPVVYADNDGRDAEITIVTVEFDFQAADGILHVKCSLKRTIAENSTVRYLFEPGNIEYELSQGPMSATLTDAMGVLEMDYTMEVAKYENEKGSISLNVSLRGGTSVTTIDNLRDGYFLENTYSFTHRKNPNSPVAQMYDEMSFGRVTGVLFVGSLAVGTVNSIYDFLSDLLDGDKGGSNDPMLLFD